MSKKNRRSQKSSGDLAPVNNPFACLDGLDLPELSEEDTAPVSKEVPDIDYPELVKHVFKIRLEKKGRRGKTVTLIYDLPNDCDDVLMAITSDLKKQLGTGGSYINGNIELQGDMRVKLTNWLASKQIRYKGDL